MHMYIHVSTQFTTAGSFRNWYQYAVWIADAPGMLHPFTTHMWTQGAACGWCTCMCSRTCTSQHTCALIGYPATFGIPRVEKLGSGGASPLASVHPESGKYRTCCLTRSLVLIIAALPFQNVYFWQRNIATAISEAVQDLRSCDWEANQSYQITFMSSTSLENTNQASVLDNVHYH